MTIEHKPSKTIITRFGRRLENIGIKIQLGGNYPWIYLDKVNDVRVKEEFYGNHGFTAFWATNCGGAKFTERRAVFKKIREMVESAS